MRHIYWQLSQESFVRLLGKNLWRLQGRPHWHERSRSSLGHQTSLYKVLLPLFLLHLVLAFLNLFLGEVTHGSRLCTLDLICFHNRRNPLFGSLIWPVSDIWSWVLLNSMQRQIVLTLEVHFGSPHGRKLDIVLEISVLRVSFLSLLWARLLHYFCTTKMSIVTHNAPIDSHLLGSSSVNHWCAILPIPQSSDILREESSFVLCRLQSPDDFWAWECRTLLFIKSCTTSIGGRCFVSEGRSDVSV